MFGNESEITDRAKGGKKPESTELLGEGIKGWWLLLIRPIEDYLIQKKIHPNVLTLTSLVMSIVSGILFHYGQIFWAGVVLLAGSTFDIFDGRVARAHGFSSAYGAFFDSCLDRISEMFIYLGILSYVRDSSFIYVVFLILGATTMVSYTRARAEGLGVECEVGTMQRTERVVYLGVFSIFNFVGNFITQLLGFTAKDVLFKVALILLLLFSLYTVFQRIYHTLSALKSIEQKEN